MSDEIRILGAPDRELETKSIFGEGPGILEIGAVQTETLKKNLKALAERLTETFSAVETKSGFTLKQATVAVELSSTGGVVLIGSLKAGAKAAVTLRARPGKRRLVSGSCEAAHQELE